MAIGNAGSRAEFVERLTAGVAATATGILVGGLGVGVAPAVADRLGFFLRLSLFFLYFLLIL